MFTLYRNRLILGKGSRDLLISEIANRINNICNHTRQIYDLHCLCNILLVKIPKIKVCNPSPLKTCFATSLTKQCHVLFEITFHICSSLFRSTDGSKPFEIAFNKICIFN